jgi:hypothetical protein
MKRVKKQKPVIRLVMTAGDDGPRLQLLAAIAMRPELLSSEHLRSIVREFEALKARVH